MRHLRIMEFEDAIIAHNDTVPGYIDAGTKYTSTRHWMSPVPKLISLVIF